MNFQVPQFIETEDKIIGPFTLRQFIYLAIAGGLSALSFLMFEKFLSLVFTAIFMGIGALLAFVKVNGRSVAYFIKSAFNYFWHPQVYVFKTNDGLTKKPKTLSDSYNDLSGLREIGEKISTSRAAVPKRELAMPPSGASSPEAIQEKYTIVQENSGARQAARRIDYR